MKKTLKDPEQRKDLMKRLRKIPADAKPKWGSLTPEKLAVHLRQAIRMSEDKIDIQFKDSILNSRFGRWLIIDSPLPWPKGLAVQQDLLAGSAMDLKSAWAALESEIEYFLRMERMGSGALGMHPVLGDLTFDQWCRLHHRHFTHHLKQFKA